MGFEYIDLSICSDPYVVDRTSENPVSYVSMTQDPERMGGEMFAFTEIYRLIRNPQRISRRSLETYKTRGDGKVLAVKVGFNHPVWRSALISDSERSRLENIQEYENSPQDLRSILHADTGDFTFDQEEYKERKEFNDFIDRELESVGL